MRSISPRCASEMGWAGAVAPLSASRTAAAKARDGKNCIGFILVVSTPAAATPDRVFLFHRAEPLAIAQQIEYRLVIAKRSEHYSDDYFPLGSP